MLEVLRAGDWISFRAGVPPARPLPGSGVREPKTNLSSAFYWPYVLGWIVPCSLSEFPFPQPQNEDSCFRVELRIKGPQRMSEAWHTESAQ